MTKVSTVLQVILGIMFLFSGIGKLTSGANDARDDLEIASWIWTTTGVVEIVLALALIASVKFVRWALPAAAGLAIVMVGAIGVHIRTSDYTGMLVPIVLLALLAVIIAIRRPQAGQLEAGPTTG